MIPSSRAGRAEQAVWTRVDGIHGGHLDLLTAHFVRHRFAPHTHEEFAVGVCSGGVEQIRYRGATHIAGPGTVVVLEPGEPHTGGPAACSGFAYRALYPSAVMLSGLAVEEAVPPRQRSGTGLPHFREAVITDDQLAGLLRACHVAMTQGCDLLEAESRLVWALGALVCRHTAAMAHIAPPAAGAQASGRLAHAVMARLGDQVADPPSLSDLAADLGLSRFHLLRAFRDAVGMPPYAWLAQHRVGRARALLDAGCPVSSAAALTGFADQAHLTRWFRRVVGVTPAAYRKSVQDSRRADS